MSYFQFCSNMLEGSYGVAIQLLGIILLLLVFNFLLKTLLIRLRVRFVYSKNVWGASFVSALHKPLKFYIWLVASVCTIDCFFSTVLHTHWFNVHLILSVLAVLAFGWFLLRWNKMVVQHMLEMSQHQEISITPGKLDLVSKLATIAVLFIMTFLLMDVTNRNIQTLIAFGGIGGLALAFASQQVISNFFGGVMIYVTQPFNIGEWVSLPERKVEGHVEEIGWYSTRIRNFEKRPIYVPNSIFTQTIVITPSRMSHDRFHHIIYLRYQDLSVVKSIIDCIKSMIDTRFDIDKQTKIDVFFTNIAVSALQIEISAYVTKLPGSYFPAIRQELLLKIADIIVEHGAKFATPITAVEIS